jgi:hypothetical protein
MEMCVARSANVVGYRGELEGAFADTREGLVDIIEEPIGKPDALLFVPSRGILEIGLGEWPNDEPAWHSSQ